MYVFLSPFSKSGFTTVGYPALRGRLHYERRNTMAQVKRKGLRSGVATEFTVFTNVLPGHEQAARETIERATHDPRRGEAVQEIGTLHEARFVLFDNDRRLM